MTELIYKIIKPETEVKATLVCVHGMQEHHARYISFARELSKQGVAVLIYDLPGHGNAFKDELGYFADQNGDEVLIQSVDTMVTKLHTEFPDVPHFLFGHSMGSIIVRLYLERNDKFSGVILCGAPNYRPAAGFGKKLAQLLVKVKGPKAKTKLLTALSVGAFSKSVKNAKTPVDWLSYNEENVQEFLKDELCGVPFTDAGNRDLFTMVSRLHHPFAAKNTSLPILFISGEDDPCTGGTLGLVDSISTLQKNGYANIENITFPKMRHEILNEKENHLVIEEIIKFICHHQ